MPPTAWPTTRQSNGWPGNKPTILAGLSHSGGYGAQPVDIYLYKNMLVEAMRTVDKGGGFYYGSNLEKVIAASRDRYPDWGIA
jgi:hypothetical protein